MKKYLYFVLILLLFIITGAALAETGPIPDKIYFDVRMKAEIGIKDTAEGKTDLFMWGVEAPLIMGLDDKTLSKLDIYNIPSSSWALSLNPIPDKKPYTWTIEGKEYFNPFAVREVRFALNFLINRQYLVDELLNGAGGPMYSCMTPVAPGTYRYNLLAARLGLTPEGDEEKALNMIEKAMQEAATLDYNKGRLVKENKWWTYDGKPVSIKFLIRADDPNGRMKVGEYVSQQIEKSGIRVERLVWDRNKAVNTWVYSDPADYLWHMYTDGWSAGGTYKFHHQKIAQMYAPWFGYMPGGAETDDWNYKHEKLDKLTKKLYQGNFLTTEEYWDTALESLETGLEESNRIYLAYSNVSFVANAERFENRMAYGLGDGLNKWSLVTANTKDDIVNVTQYSSKGGLFMDAWDPVGSTGFSDVYSNNIATALSDWPIMSTPSAAEWMGNTVKVLDYENKMSRKEDGTLVGEIEVPANAIKYDSAADAWVSAKGNTSFSKGEYELVEYYFHHGIPMTIVDYLYAKAFVEEWVTKDSEDDPYYEEQYASYLGPGQKTSVAAKYDIDNGKITTYFDYNFPPSKMRAATFGAPAWSVTAVGQHLGVSWEIVEALARIVIDGGDVTGKNYAFANGVEGAVEVNVINADCVTDILAELKQMKKEGYIPVYIDDFVTTDYVVERYDAAINFIEKYNHAFISNGPFYISDFDSNANFMELTAVRENYPRTAQYWIEKFKTERLIINEVDAPVMVESGQNIDVNVYVSQVTFPESEQKLVEEGQVKLILINGEEEIEIETEQVIEGMFMARIPSEITKTLEAGSYSVVAVASVGKAVPSTSPITIVVY